MDDWLFMMEKEHCNLYMHTYMTQGYIALHSEGFTVIKFVSFVFAKFTAICFRMLKTQKTVNWVMMALKFSWLLFTHSIRHILDYCVYY